MPYACSPNKPPFVYLCHRPQPQSPTQHSSPPSARPFRQVVGCTRTLSRPTCAHSTVGRAAGKSKSTSWSPFRAMTAHLYLYLLAYHQLTRKLPPTRLLIPPLGPDQSGGSTKDRARGRPRPRSLAGARPGAEVEVGAGALVVHPGTIHGRISILRLASGRKSWPNFCGARSKKKRQ